MSNAGTDRYAGDRATSASTSKPVSVVVAADLEYEVTSPSSFVLAVTAARTRRQIVVAERLDVDPDLDAVEVGYGETPTHQLLRFDAPPGTVRIAYSATVRVEAEVDRPAALGELPFGAVPPEALPYLNPSRYCPSDLLVDVAHRWFGDIDPGFVRVAAIRDWVQANLDYVGGSTDSTDDATSVLVQRAGVCRDYAHVMISLCRAIGIPARYVSGYGVDVDPPDFHGFVEVFLSEGWYLLDPTGMAPPNGLVRIAHGRDAADVPFASFSGTATLEHKQVSVTATLDASGPDRPTSTI